MKTGILYSGISGTDTDARTQHQKEITADMSERERRFGIEAVIGGMLALVFVANGLLFSQFLPLRAKTNSHVTAKSATVIHHAYQPGMDTVH